MRGTITAVLLAILAFSFSASAQTNAVQAPPKRVLFIVETSSATKAASQNAQKLLATLVESGMGGLMETGDTFGVWTFNQQLYSGQMPMQHWSMDKSSELAANVSDFLNRQKFEKEPQMDPVILPMLSVIRNSHTITIVLVTSGKKPIQGTPFDREINEFYKQNYRDFQKRKTPFVTMLLAQKGSVLRHSISPAVGDVKIPKPLPMPEPEPVRIAAPAIPPAKPAEKPAAPVAAPDTKALVITRSGAKRVDATNELELPPIQITKPVEPVPPAPETNVAEPIAEPAPAQSTPQEIETKVVVEEVKPIEPTPAIAAPVQMENAPEGKAPAEVATKVTETATPAAVSIEKAIAPIVAAVAQGEHEQPVAASTAQKIQPPPPVPMPEIPNAKPEAPIAPEPVAPLAAPAAPIVVSAPVPTAAPEPVSPQVAVISTEPNVSETQSMLNPKTYLIIAFALVFAAVITAFFIGRHTARKRSHSLITDWANRS